MPFGRLGRENEKITKPYQDFSRGWNADVAPDLLDDREFELADNIRLDERGAFSKRPGSSPFNEEPYEDVVERIIEWPRDDGSVVLLALIGNCLCVVEEPMEEEGGNGNGNNGNGDNGDDEEEDTLPKLLKEFWDQEPVEIGYYWFQNKFYFTGKENVAGVDTYWVYDGDTVELVTPNAGETNDLGPIKRCRIFAWSPKSMRIFATGDREDPTALYYSELIDPTYFKNTSILHPTTADGPTTGLSTFGDALVVTYRFSVWVWKGTDPSDDAIWTPLPVTYGTPSHQTIQWTPNSLTFLSSGNLVSLHLGLLDYTIVMMAGEELVGTHSRDKVSSVLRSITNPNKTVAIFDRREERYYLAYSDDPNDSRNNRILVMEWASKSFVRDTGLQANDFCYRTNGDVLIASGKYIIKIEEGLDDWDVEEHTYKPVEMEVHTKQYDLDGPFNRKKFHKIFLASRQREGYRVVNSEEEPVKVPIESNVDVEIIVDYHHQARLVPIQESLWVGPWGDYWGWRSLITKEMRFGGQKLKGLRCALVIKNDNLGEAVTIYGIAFEFKYLKAQGVKLEDG